MKLMLLRHAEPERDSATGRDRDRRLTGQGCRQAQFIAEQFVKGGALAGSAPVAILSSPAERTAATARIVARALGLRPKLTDDLGEDAEREVVLQLVHGLVNTRATPVLVVSHQPQLERLILDLSGDDDDVDHAELICFSVQSQSGRLRARELDRLSGGERA